MAKVLFLLACMGLGRFASAQQPAPSVVFSSPVYNTPFLWQHSLEGGILHRYAALLIPVSLAHSSKTYYMQLDTGSPVSILYGHSFGKMFPGDSVDVEIRVGGRKITLKKPSFFTETSSNVSPRDTIIIGTLGTDILENHIVQVDYPRQTLTLTDKLPAAVEKRVSWSPFMYQRGRILLPAVIEGQSKLLYFDSGSSGFELLTNAETWSRLAHPDSVRRSYPVQSWNKTLIVHTVASRDSIGLGGQRLPLRYVSYIEGTSDAQARQMKASGMGGMTGNKLFLPMVLVLDLKNQRFGVWKR